MKYKNFIGRCILMCMLCMSGLTGYAADNDDIIEFQGDRYVIHVDKMKQSIPYLVPKASLLLQDIGRSFYEDEAVYSHDPRSEEEATHLSQSRCS